MSAAAGALRPAVRNDKQRQGREQAFTNHSYAQRADAAMPRRRGSGVSSSETYTGAAMIDSTPVDSIAMSHSGGRSTSYQAQLNSSVHSQGNISSETHEPDVSAAKHRSNSAKVAPGSRRASIAEKAGHSRQRDGTSRKRGGTRTKIFWADERGEMLTIVCDVGLAQACHISAVAQQLLAPRRCCTPTPCPLRRAGAVAAPCYSRASSVHELTSTCSCTCDIYRYIILIGYITALLMRMLQGTHAVLFHSKPSASSASPTAAASPAARHSTTLLRWLHMT